MQPRAALSQCIQALAVSCCLPGSCHGDVSLGLFLSPQPSTLNPRRCAWHALVPRPRVLNPTGCWIPAQALELFFSTRGEWVGVELQGARSGDASTLPDLLSGVSAAVQEAVRLAGELFLVGMQCPVLHAE
jgi:hypothetical protein